MRPHESLNQETPESCYRHSGRPYKELAEPFAYPAHFEARYVASNGMIHFRGKRFFLSESLTSEEVGLEEIEDRLWRVDFGPLTLGNYDEESDTFIHEVQWKADEPPTIEQEVIDSNPSQGSPILPV